MGFLELGVPLHWRDSLLYAAYVRRHGVEQFLATYHKVKGRVNDKLKWGDEVRARARVCVCVCVCVLRCARACAGAW